MSGITHTVAINIVHHVLIFRQYVYIQVNKVESEYFSRYEKKMQFAIATDVTRRYVRSMRSRIHALMHIHQILNNCQVT